MDLSVLNLTKECRSDTGNVVDDFYIPCLSKSSLYKRSVGYFTSYSLAKVAKGLVELIHHGGNMQLIASPSLSEQDIAAIQLGQRARNDVILYALVRQLENVEETIVLQRLGFLAKLIAENRLEIKIAVLRGKIQKGIYHEKLGLFQDQKGNMVAFSGSANETEGGLYNNFEQTDVFCSWRKEDKERVVTKHRHFEELWMDATEGVEVIEFTEAIKQSLLPFKKHAVLKDPESGASVPKKEEIIAVSNNPQIPNNFHLREYQKAAIISWFQHEGSGIFEMATGTGKTITALSTAVLLYQNIKQLAVIIVCPFSHLVKQWADEADKFSYSSILAFKSKVIWEHELNRQVVSFNIGNSDSFCVITTNRTFISEHFQASIRRLTKSTMLIVDEAHHIGAEEAINQLPSQIRYKLALSATPERWMDPEGTNKINAYFAPGVIFQFGLKEAIGHYLTEYYYYPHLVELTDEENEEYHILTKKIARASNFGKKNVEIEFNTGNVLRNLLIKRARLIGRARNKTKLLRELMLDRVESKYNIFYCGDEKVDGVRQLEEVMMMLGQELRMKVHPFTSAESNEERQQILKDFETGDLQGLVAIRCLDEGVDVPATQTAYILASSTNPREFIQRRGRILRKHPLKQFSYIHDFIVIPRNLDDVQKIEPAIFNTERSLMTRELQRVSEFASLAFNGPEAQAMLLDVKSKYNLLDL